MKVDYGKIRELLEKAECVEHFYIKGEEFSILERRLYQKAISLLPKPCEKVFSCRHFKEYSQSVPMPFGSGSCSEPLGDCAIESESENCCLGCPDYKEAGCRPEQQLNKPPADEIEEFVKEASAIVRMGEKSYEAMRACEGHPSGCEQLLWGACSKLKRACTHLEALLKQIKETRRAIHCMGERTLPTGSYDEDVEICERVSEVFEQLEGEKKRLEEENAGLLKLTELLDEHPEGYDGPCLCKLCMSYG